MSQAVIPNKAGIRSALAGYPHDNDGCDLLVGYGRDALGMTLTYEEIR